MVARDLIMENFRWKLTALFLAMLVWFVIKLAIYKENAGGQNQLLLQHHVMVLQAPDDPRIFRLQPPNVDLAVQAPAELRPDDLEVFVDLTSFPDVRSAFKQIVVRGGNTFKVISVKPWGVTVELAGALDLSLTNSLRKP
jgi:hypothetical protein